MRRISIAFRTAALVALIAAAAAPRERARETADIGVEDAAAPWSQPDGTGYANDLVRAAFAVAGVDVRMHVLPYARCKQQVVAGQLVACVSMSPADELRGRVRFSARPLFVFSSEFFENLRRPLPPRIDRFVPGTRVGTVLGYEYAPEMLVALAERRAVLDPAPTEEDNLRKLAAGRIDAAVVNCDVVKSAEWVAERAGVSGRVRSVFSIGHVPGYIGFSLAHPRGRILADRFDAGFARLIATGERDRIQRRWIARARAKRSTP